MLDLETFKLRAKNLYPPSSLERKEIVLRLYDRFLKNKGLQPNLESLNLWLDDLLQHGLSNSTLTVYTYDVLSYFEIMMLDVDDKKLKLLKKRLPPQKIGEVDFLTDEEIAKLIEATPSPTRKLIYILCYTYARRLGEVLNLTRQDVNFENNTITFKIFKKKREEKATFDLEPWIKELIIKYNRFLGENKLFERTKRAIDIAFKKDCEKAGIKPQGRNLRPHILRHSRITSLRNRGIPLDFVSKFLARHSRFDITVRFYRGVTEQEKISIPKAEEIFKLNRVENYT